MTLEDLVIYEVHVGTATTEGTFEGLIKKLKHFVNLGVTALQLMPVYDFPGERNWGYDSIFHYAPAEAYGGYIGLQRLVDEAHTHNLAVILDLSLNHIGSYGSPLIEYSLEYKAKLDDNKWGGTFNLNSTEVRRFLVDNAIYWANEYRVDGLRIDALQSMPDDKERDFLANLTEKVRVSIDKRLSFVVLAEDERNDSDLLNRSEHSDSGHKIVTKLDAIFADDFHHQTFVALTDKNEKRGYYQGYSGTVKDLVATLENGWFYIGQKSPLNSQQRGKPTKGIHPNCFIYFIDNHDQSGNRPHGERLNHLISDRAYRAASALFLLSPHTPMIFMGQEWGASTPFLYFTNHTPLLTRDGEVEKISEIKQNRLRDLRDPDKGGHLVEDKAYIDPEAIDAFKNSILKWNEITKPKHSKMLFLYKDLLRQRFQLTRHCGRNSYDIRYKAIGEDILILQWKKCSKHDEMVLFINLRGDVEFDLSKDEITSSSLAYPWKIVLDTENPKYGGTVATRMKGHILELKGPVALLFSISAKKDESSDLSGNVMKWWK